MVKLGKTIGRAGWVVLVVLALIIGSTFVPTQVLAATSPLLGAAASYSVLAGETVTNTGPTTMNFNLGVSPGSAVTGFLPGIVGLPGTIHAADADAAAAQVSNTAVFGFIDQPYDVIYAGVKDLAGLNLGPGVYYAPAGFILTGNLTLTGSGVWIFKSGSTLITSPYASVTGGDPCNVWWRVGSSATLDTYTKFIGNILALTSIHLKTGATLNGRALAQTGEVTLDSNVIYTLPCGASTGPHLSLTKFVTPATYSQVGDVLNYTLFAINDGNVDLDNVSISDLDPGFTITGSTPPSGSTLIPGATMTVTGTHIITQTELNSGSFTNTANATGLPEEGGEVSATASHEIFRAKSIGDGEVGTINKAGILAPWLGLGLVLVLGGVALIVLSLRRRKSR